MIGNPWIELFDSNHTIYANDLHRQVHFKLIAKDISEFIWTKDTIVLDFCCGEALSANYVASFCKKLFLIEPASSVLFNLKKRFSKNNKIAIYSMEEISEISDQTIDMVVMHSVIQYMTSDELEEALSHIKRILSPKGIFILGDVIPPDSNAITDAISLLNFGKKNGFLLPAILTLIKTFFSKYRKLRTKYGLFNYSDEQILEILSRIGFKTSRRPRNIGHNQSRKTYQSQIDSK